jgi:hypothetical protein
MTDKFKGIASGLFIQPLMFHKLSDNILNRLDDNTDCMCMYKVIRASTQMSTVEYNVSCYTSDRFNNYITGVICADGNILVIRLDKCISSWDIELYVCHILYDKILYDIVVPNEYVTSIHNY